MLLKITGLGLHGVHADLGADIEVELAARHGGKGVPQGLLHRLKPCLAAVEKLHRAFAQKLPVIAAELFVVDGLTLGDIPEAGDGVVLIAAHLLQAALHGVAALFIHPAADKVEKLFLLAVHILGQEQAAARDRRKEHLRHE